MHAWEAIQKTIDEIEIRIGEELAVEELAKLAALSDFYYQRLFSMLVKKPLREYIKLRRLARSCESLVDKQNRILDVALEYGFGSHEVYTRSFKSAYGLTPAEYRDNPVNLNHFVKPDLLLGYVLIDEGVPLISDGLVLEINRKAIDSELVFVGVQGHVSIAVQIPNGEKTGVDMPGEIWGTFNQEVERIPGKPNGRRLGVAYMGDAPQGYFTYFAGIETRDQAEIGDFTSWTLPAREYIVCGFEAETFDELVTSALAKATNYMGLWLKKHNMAYGSFSAELYFDDTPNGAYMEIWAPYTVSQP